jgi:phosphoribosyl 1,2-cyclic phosphodiesterase
MRFAVLGSGSQGNGTLIASADTYVLVDCGFSLRETEKRLLRLGVTERDTRNPRTCRPRAWRGFAVSALQSTGLPQSRHTARDAQTD